MAASSLQRASVRHRAWLVVLATIVLALPGDEAGSDGWVPNGAPLCLAPGSPYEPACSDDGAGGATVVWTDLRDGVASGHVYAARVREDGLVDPGWPVDGARVSTHPDAQRLPSIVAVGDGGVLVLFHSMRTTTQALRLQRLTPNGQVAPGWPLEGRIVGPPVAPGSGFGEMVADSAGDVVVAHIDETAVARSIRIFKFAATGEPYPSWPVEGVLALSMSASSESTFFGRDAFLHSDRQGGVWVLSHMEVSGFEEPPWLRWHLVHIDAQGALWPGGARLIVTRAGTFYAHRPGAVVAGGSFLFCGRDPLEENYPQSYVHGRVFDPDGSERDLGVLGAAEGPVWLNAVHADTKGGAFLEFHTRLWRVGFVGLAAQVRWSMPYLSFYSPGDRWGRAFVDREGGLYNMRVEPDVNAPLPCLRFLHVLGETGAWDPPASQFAGVGVTVLDPRVGDWCGTRTRSGGVAVFWAGNRRGEYDLYYTGSATSTSTRRPVAVHVEAGAGRVEIEWWVAAAGLRELRFERSDPFADWQGCGSVEVLAGDRLLATDPDPPRGGPQDYRLSGSGEDGPFVSDPVRVDLGAPAGLAIEAASPQRGGVSFRVTGGPSGPLETTCRDVAGRIVARDRRSAGNPGRVRFEVPAGIYWLSVRQGAKETSRRVVVLP